MSKTKVVNLAVIALLLLFGTAPAYADEFSFDFESPASGGISVAGLITTSDTLNVLGNFDVTAITGTFNGAPIGPLLFNPNQPFVFNAPDGNFWDNNLSPAPPFVTVNGIGFNFEGDELVLFSGVTGDPLSEGLFFQNLGESAIGTLSVAPVPEPAAWVSVLSGFLTLGAFGFTLRRKRPSLHVF
jgi:hypothetical protein